MKAKVKPVNYPTPPYELAKIAKDTEIMHIRYAILNPVF